MNKSDIAERIPERLVVSKAPPKDPVDALLKTSGDVTMTGDELWMPQLSPLTSRYRPARPRRSPPGGTSLPVAASRLSQFRPFKRRKHAVKDDNALRDVHLSGSGTSTVHAVLHPLIGNVFPRLWPHEHKQSESKHFSHRVNAHHLFGDRTP